MNDELNGIVQYWKEEYSSHLKEYSSYDAGEQFRRVASIFTPGRSFYYIVNFHDLQLDELSKSVTKFVQKDYEKIRMEDLLATIIPEDLKGVANKEGVIKDFYNRFLSKEEILSYKVVYSYRSTGLDGEIKNMLHQATILSTDENGIIRHAFSMHTDVSHLNLSPNDDISFIHMDGGISYCNIKTDTGSFDPKNTEFEDNNLNQLFSDREKEIIKMLAEGHNAKDIAEALNLSPHTVRTHRRNMLSKTGYTNTAQLIAKCLVAGVINME
ncbi:response regulator transcription factor [Christiangramia flava]|uniref:Transcriptional regulator, LuxR family n=1 Tax=Christiangramia flava JLT2011 TaxID=1229726 RepID=A0A1L7I2F7_9FLAO|nr:helix-turn-helix transcriptional regulator [Christiangramia flava]APU67780.1 Transcriptional regulator, LuxR family [Christiangramia flava JLT2011]OSS40283.1 LuxR family transcriptional regulator protein [Christiangramia flava JLT2011]